MEILDKLKILSDSAKYDVSCSSSGSKRKNLDGTGNGHYSGICHSFSADGRCVSLLKILMTNNCIYDCKYCVNRKTNNIPRTIFTPEELAELTMNFYRRNYIEGLFLSSGIIKDADYTMSKLYETVKLLRTKYKFNGYIHVKTIPKASKHLIDKLGKLVDRMSINIELPSHDSLKLLAPNKAKEDLVTPMKHISKNIKTQRNFTRAGQTSQMIIGATPDSDLKILTLAENMYDKFSLKRVYYSGYISVNKDTNLPALKNPPLVRENRLYQADWLLRFYDFKVDEILDTNTPNFNYLMDPKSNWAINNYIKFPVEINNVDYKTLIRIPGIGILSAQKIVKARMNFDLSFEDLKRMRISLKKAQYFITCKGKSLINVNNLNIKNITTNLISEPKRKIEQISMFDYSLGDII